MKALFDITMVALTLWIGLFKLINPLGENAADPAYVEGEPAMVVTDTLSPDEAAVQDKMAADLRATQDALASGKAEAEKREQTLAAEKAALQKQISDEQKKADENRKAEEQKKAAAPKAPDEGAKQAGTLHWLESLEAGVAKAKELHRKVFIDFEGEGCLVCRQLALNVYNSPEVSGRLRTNFVPIWLYSTNSNDNHRSEFMSKSEKQSHRVFFPMAVILDPADGSWSYFYPVYNSEKSRAENIATFITDLEAAGS